MIRILWDRLHTTIWFIPAMLSTAAVVLAMLLVEIDLRAGARDWPWLEVFRIGTTGVRQVLAVTTGAMMTITGVVFSISVVTLTLAANQFGAKILRNYLSDTNNKLVLGLFVGSFLFGLVVLTSIDSDSGGQIPTLAFMASLILTMVAIAGLIYFIHNISTSIQADRMIAVIGRNLSKMVTDTLSAREEPRDDTTRLRESWSIATKGDIGMPVRAQRSGYLEFIDYDALIAVADRSGCMIDILVRPGHFTIKGNPVARIFAPDGKSAADPRDIDEHISIGSLRTAVQDLEYSSMQLLQIAQRALSPGINDSLTAIACIDWLSAALAAMAGRQFPFEYQANADGIVRLKTCAFDFAGAVDAVFSPLRQNARGNEMVTLRLLEAIAAIMTTTPDKPHLETLREHADLIFEAAGEAPMQPHDLREIAARHAVCAAAYDAGIEQQRDAMPA